jgi:arylsulfatase
VFLSIVMATLDVTWRLRDLPFVSESSRVSFFIEAHGIYLGLIAALGALSLLIARAARSIHGRSAERVALVLLLSLCFAAVGVRVTPVELGHWSAHDIGGLLLLGLLSLGISWFLSGLLLRLRRPGALWTLSLAVLLAGILIPPFTRRPPREKPFASGTSPPVILILVDALRADHLGCYGREESASPTIDRLAQTATVFTDARSSSSWTKSSIASLFTALSPSRHGVLGETDVLDDHVPLLASLLQEKGYRTAAFVGNPWLSPLFGFSRGFSLYCDRFNLLRRLFPLEQLYRKGLLASEVYPDGKEILGTARAWIEKNAAAPFFLYVHLMDVHDPYLPPPPFDRMYLGREFQTLERRDLAAREKAFRTASSDSTLLPLVRGLYAGGVAYADHLIGNFLSFLGAQGILERSLVIITADHGEEFLEHGGTTHGKRLHEETLRVPLIVRLPSGATGAVVDEPVCLLDILPTVLEAAGSDPPHGEGESLLPLLEGKQDATHRFDGRARISELKTREHYLQAIRQSDWKIVRKQEEGGAETVELYDLQADPGETHDLSRARPDVVETLVALLPARPAEEGGGSQLPEDLKQRLRALGYVLEE